jgi:hypothetical protein
VSSSRFDLDTSVSVRSVPLFRRRHGDHVATGIFRFLMRIQLSGFYGYSFNSAVCGSNFLFGGSYAVIMPLVLALPLLEPLHRSRGVSPAIEIAMFMSKTAVYACCP